MNNSNLFDHLQLVFIEFCHMTTIIIWVIIVNINKSKIFQPVFIKFIQFIIWLKIIKL